MPISTHVTLDRRSRKINGTRRRFAEKAILLFENKGFSNTTVEEIASRADYSASTFFRYFSDKEEVVFYDFSDRKDELKATFELPDHGDAWLAIKSSFIKFADRWDGDSDNLGIRRFRIVYNEPVLFGRFLGYVAAWESYMAELVMDEYKGDPKKEVLYQVVAGAASAAFRAGIQAKLADEKLSFSKCVIDAFDQLENIGTFFDVVRS